MTRARTADLPFAAYPTYIRRHGPLIVVCMLAGLLAGVAVGHRVATYVGTAAVLVPPTDFGPHGVPGAPTTPLREKDAVTPDTEALIATSAPVLSAVRAATGLKAGDAALAKRVSIDAPANTQVLTLSFEARHPKAAKAGAQAAAVAFLAVREHLIADRQAADLSALNAQIAALRDDLAEASARTVTGGSTGRTLARIEQGTVTDKIRSLQRTATRLGTARTNAGMLLRPAEESALHVRLGREVPATSGLMIGLLGGLVLSRLRRRVFVAAWDVRRADPDTDPVDVLSLSPVAAAGGRRRRSRQGQTARTDAGLRRLRNSVVADGAGVTLLTGPARPVVTAGIAGGLARSLARLGESVAVLVDDRDERVLAGLRVSPGSLQDVDTTPVTSALRRGRHAARRRRTGSSAGLREWLPLGDAATGVPARGRGRARRAGCRGMRVGACVRSGPGQRGATSHRHPRRHRGHPAAAAGRRAGDREPAHRVGGSVTRRRSRSSSRRAIGRCCCAQHSTRSWARTTRVRSRRSSSTTKRRPTNRSRSRRRTAGCASCPTTARPVSPARATAVR